MADHQPGSHLAGLIRSTIPPIHPGGRPIVLGTAAGALGARLVLRTLGLKRTGRTVGRIGLAAAGASAAFFRAPIRVRPLTDGAVIAPADGLVSLIEEAAPPEELGLDPTPRPRISIFLSIFDVHVQRIPIDGLITGMAYRPGAFLSADLDKASTDNERNSLVIEPTIGGQIVVTQIAGLIARRIVSDAVLGAPVLAGDTYGLIRFGSRVDTYLPAGTPIVVRKGQRTIGGETVLAVLDVAGWGDGG
jgi:phosphatidylserine decarboxylase